jgi:hypothetical protein
MEHKDEKLSIPILRNWIAYKQEVPCQGHYEYELLSDVAITGDSGDTDFGPYKFMTAFKRGKEIEASSIVRIDNRLLNNQTPCLDKTNVEYYHGGGLVDEIAAFVSLMLGIRVKAGRMIREFRSSDDRFGHPVGWDKIQTIPEIKPLYGHYKLPAVIHEPNIVLFEPFKSLPQLSEDNVIFLIKAARLYQNALWIAETDPSLAWIMFVSALETAAEQWRKNQEPPSTRLMAAKPGLYDYLISLNIPDIVDKVATHITDSLGVAQKFSDFVVNFFPNPPESRPPLAFQCSWDKVEIQKMMKIIYNYRSEALHDGTPFPWPMCEAPIRLPEFLAPAEKPPGLGAFARNGTWLIKDTPMLLNTFEYITRKCLLAWWSQLNNKV